MRLFVEHDARALAAMLGETAPDCDSLILEHGRPDVVLASCHRGNILASDWLMDADLPGSQVVCWSGTLGEDLFAREPRNWMRPGREALDAFCREVGGQMASHGRRLCLQPHARHVLSDMASCANLLRRHEGSPVGIALSPATMLEPSMMGDLEDHLTRMFETLGPRCAMLMLADVDVALGDDGDEWCAPAPLGRGRLPREHVRMLVREHLPPDTPIVMRAADLGAHAAWIAD